MTPKNFVVAIVIALCLAMIVTALFMWIGPYAMAFVLTLPIVYFIAILTLEEYPSLRLK